MPAARLPAARIFRRWQTSFAALLLGLAVGWLPPAAIPAAAQSGQPQQRAVSVDGQQRQYILYVPPGVAQPAPLVLVFHGGGGRAEGMMRLTRMNEVADRGHFIVAYPQGEGRGRGGTWNVGGGYSPSRVDDVGFVKAMLADIGGAYPLDARRIYAAGWSMGGVFSYRLACEMSTTFAAIAPVAATMVQPGCAPRSPVSVLQIQGTADQNIPIDGGSGTMTAMGRDWPPVANSVRFWAKADSCAAAETTTPNGPETTCQTYSQCRATVEYCIIRGGGHAWPGMTPQAWQRRFDVYVTQTYPASERVWAFFAAHPKP